MAMDEGEVRHAALEADRLESGLRLLARTWIAFVVTCWVSIGWTTRGQDHVIQPVALLLSPLLLFGLARTRPHEGGRARDLATLTLFAAVVLVVLDPVLGYLRGTIAAAALPFVGVPLFCVAMWAWTVDQGLGSAATRPWARAIAWSTPFALLVLGAWFTLVLRGVLQDDWSDIDIDNWLTIFLAIVGIGILLPGSIIATWMATRHTSRGLQLRPYRGLR